MKHVFVETNWVVAYAAPAHLQLPAALSLAERAAAGELRLYIPSVCLTEARYRSGQSSIRIWRPILHGSTWDGRRPRGRYLLTRPGRFGGYWNVSTSGYDCCKPILELRFCTP